MSAPFLRALWLVRATKVYSGLGANIVMESLHSSTKVWRSRAQGSAFEPLPLLNRQSVAPNKRATNVALLSKSYASQPMFSLLPKVPPCGLCFLG